MFEHFVKVLAKRWQVKEIKCKNKTLKRNHETECGLSFKKEQKKEILLVGCTFVAAVFWLCWWWWKYVNDANINDCKTYINYEDEKKCKGNIMKKWDI